MTKIIKYNLLFLFIWSNQTLAKFVEPESEDIPTETSGGTLSFMSGNSIIEIVTFLFAFVFILSIIGFLFSGLKFMTAGGSEGALDGAHKTWIASLTGLVVSLVGYIIVYVAKIIFF